MRMLQPIGEGLWCAVERSRAYGVELGSRMTVVRVSEGALFVHAPIGLSHRLRAAVDALGEVRFVCAPNLRTCDGLPEWGKAYPAAERYAAPGALEQQRALRPLTELSGEPVAAWQGALEPLLFDGIPTVNEVVFFHRDSRTLLLADLAVHVPSRSSLLARAILRLNLGGLTFGPTRDLRWLVSDRAAAQRSLEQVLAWDFERVVVRRGDVLERGGKQALRRAYQWLAADPAWWQ